MNRRHRGTSDDPRRAVPSVEAVVEAVMEELAAESAKPTAGDAVLAHPVLVRCAREAVDAARERATAGIAVDRAGVVADARARATAVRTSLLAPVINATGVLVHTNLGRAPLALEAVDAVRAVSTGYSNLEYRLDAGERGSRHDHAGTLLADACGAEAGMVVNNNAAAVLLTLAALARGRPVVVSRGELVEIGGGFRVPDVMTESGAVLVEVGTTNRTRRADYEAAVTADTALLLKVHASNYRMIGFVESATVSDLASLGPPLVVDAGSGLLDERTPWLPGGRPEWLGDEPGVRQCLEAGAALVTFSGDKLLGGPQAGCIVGRSDLVAQVGRHPLARAVRADKMTLAAMNQVANTYLSGDATSIPLWRMATIPLTDLQARADALAERASGWKVVPTHATAGGGSLPGLTIPSIGLTIGAPGGRADALLAAMRAHNVVGRAERGAVILDLRTVDPAHDHRLATVMRAAGDDALHAG